MTTTYVATAPGDFLQGGDRFRATWAATKAFSSLPFFGADLASNMQALYDGRITQSRLAFPISKPVVRDGDKAGTLDVQVMQEAARQGATVAQLARALEGAATIGRNLELVRLEKFEHTPTSGGSAGAVAGRTQATADGQAEAEEGGIGGFFKAVGRFYQSAGLMVGIGLAIGGLLYLTIKRKGAAGIDWH